MNIKDKLLFYGVWGGIIGAGLYFGTNYVWHFFAPYYFKLYSELVDPYSQYVGSLTIIFNLIYAVFAGVLISSIASLLIVFVLKAKNLSYIVIPSIVFLGLSYWPIINSIEYLTAPNAPGTIASFVLRPIEILIAFIAVVWGGNKLSSRNHKIESSQNDARLI